MIDISLSFLGFPWLGMASLGDVTNRSIPISVSSPKRVMAVKVNDCQGLGFVSGKPFKPSVM